MKDPGIAVHHAAPLSSKCGTGLSGVRGISRAEEAGFEGRRFPWESLWHGARHAGMPVVVVGGKSFSAPGAFGEKALTAELGKSRNS